MEIKIKTKSIKNILKKYNSVISSNYFNTELIHLIGIRIKAYNEKITFEGKNENLELKLEENKKENFKTNKKGEILIKYKLINEIISKLDEEWIEIKTIEGKILNIKTIESNYEINTMDIEKFQPLELEKNYKENFKVNINNFKNALNKIIFSGDEKHYRRIFRGINLKVKENKLKLIASDSIRVSVSEIEINKKEELNKIIPIKNLKDFIKISENIDQEIEIKFSDLKILFVFEQGYLKFDLIEGIFPDLERIFEKEEGEKLIISRELMIQMIEKTTTLISDKLSNEIFVKMFYKNGELFLENRTQEIGFSKISTKKNKFEGKELEILFNPRLLLEALKYKNEENCVFNFFGNERPFILEFENKKDFKCLILPFKKF